MVSSSACWRSDMAWPAISAAWVCAGLSVSSTPPSDARIAADKVSRAARPSLVDGERWSTGGVYGTEICVETGVASGAAPACGNGTVAIAGARIVV